MKEPARVRHEFVEFIPNELNESTLYISITYATCVHLCLCGCGHRVVTPLSPADWRLTFDGESVSLEPSVGNWNFGCQSHYWIERGVLYWADRWPREKIAANRAFARGATHRRFGEVERAPVVVSPGGGTKGAHGSGWRARLLRRVRL